MSVYSGPEIIDNGLVLAYDMLNTQKSWRGPPVTNYISFPEASYNGSSFVNFGYNYANLGATYTYGVGVSNPVNAPGVLRYFTGTTGYKYFSIDSTSLPVTGTYTFSYYARITSAGNNNVGNSQLWRANGSDRSVTGNWNPTFTPEWVRYSTTGPAEAGTILQYFPIHSGSITGGCTIEYCGFQLEVGSYATPFVIGSRNNTQAIVDLTGNSILTINSLTYSSNNTFSFTGASSNNITVPVSTSSTNAIGRSWEAWVMPSATQTTAGLFGSVVGGGCTYYCNGGICIASGNYQFNWFDNVAYQFLDSGVAATINVPVHIVGTYDASDTKCRIYINGVLKNTGVATNMSYGGGVNLIQIGYLSASGNYYTGTINNINHYFNYALSAGEVAQNFNAHSGRYGL